MKTLIQSFISLLLIIPPALLFAQPSKGITSKLKCITGNCINGTGSAKLNDSREIEGNFKNGVPTGEVSIYGPGRQLMYKGFTEDLLPEGEGMKYEKRTGGGTYLAEKGTFKKGYLDFGTVYNEDGQELSHGSYMPDESRRLIGGYMRITYRGKNAYLHCDDLLSTDKDGRSTCTGWTTIRENVPYTGKTLAHYYTLNRRDSLYREWDHDNGFCYLIRYKNGKPVEDFSGSTIVRISDKRTIAANVRYAPGFEADGQMINHIISGDFKLDGGFRTLSGPASGSDINYFRQLYARTPDNGPGAARTTIEASTNSNSKYSEQVLSNCRETIAHLRERALQALEYYKAGYEEEKGYARNKKIYETYQKELIPQCESAITEFKGRVPYEMMEQLIDIKNAISTNMYMGVMKSMPVLKN